MFGLEAGQETSARELGRAVDAGNVKPELGGSPRVVIKQPKVDPEAFPSEGADRVRRSSSVVTILRSCGSAIDGSTFSRSSMALEEALVKSFAFRGKRTAHWSAE